MCAPVANTCKFTEVRLRQMLEFRVGAELCYLSVCPTQRGYIERVGAADLVVLPDDHVGVEGKEEIRIERVDPFSREGVAARSTGQLPLIRRTIEPVGGSYFDTFPVSIAKRELVFSAKVIVQLGQAVAIDVGGWVGHLVVICKRVLSRRWCYIWSWEKRDQLLCDWVEARCWNNVSGKGIAHQLAVRIVVQSQRIINGDRRIPGTVPPGKVAEIAIDPLRRG